MSTQKDKFALFAALGALGFTYEESAALRRIGMTLRHWAEAECNGDIQRDEKSGVAYRYYGHGNGPFFTVRVADREAGALKRLAAILSARNSRAAGPVACYHQGDPRGCTLYLVKASDILV